MSKCYPIDFKKLKENLSRRNHSKLKLWSTSSRHKKSDNLAWKNILFWSVVHFCGSGALNHKLDHTLIFFLNQEKLININIHRPTFPQFFKNLSVLNSWDHHFSHVWLKSQPIFCWTNLLIIQPHISSLFSPCEARQLLSKCVWFCFYCSVCLAVWVSNNLAFNPSPGILFIVS